MKKIGIITIHNSPNYGACLQSFALFKFLEQKGYDVEIIDLHRPCYDDYVYSKKYLPYKHWQKGRKAKIRDLFLKLIGKVPAMPKRLTNLDSKHKFDLFNSQIKLSKAYKSIDELYNDPPKYDVYLTGSDQLWNPTQPFCIEPYFLTFVNNPKSTKVSFAASVGISNLTKEEIKDFIKWLQGYSSISVREKSAQLMLQSLVEKKIEVVADPTFLLGTSFWANVAIKPNFENYILVFTLSVEPHIIEYARKLSLESNKQLIVLHQLLDTNVESYIAVNDAGPCEFLGYIANADLVITDSFHCTVFSILLGAQNFYSYISPYNVRGSRILDLLDLTGLSSHLLSTELGTSYDMLSSNTIDRERVHEIIMNEQIHARTFLQAAIDG